MFSDNNNNPIWDEIHYFLISEEEDALVVEVFDFDDIGNDDLLGSSEVYLPDANDGPLIIALDHILGGVSAAANGGRQPSVTIEINRLLCLDPVEEIKDASGMVIKKPDPVQFYNLMKVNRRVELAISRVGLRDPLNLVYIFLHSASGLYMSEKEIEDYTSYAVITFDEMSSSFADDNDSRAPELKVWPKKRQTKPSNRGVNPRWRQGWYFLAKSCESFTVTIKKLELKKQDEVLGTVRIELEDIGNVIRNVSDQGSLKLTVRVAPCRGLL
eukprot:TRINITY_DN2754_c0_g1_i1.p1 TRINITY_DN2754_c0_g1~~TRINITY_DN2754_c0_g1_i1.p1  ORF type:complete len:271 (+),score=73.66 TRINITY_DN2754_c0_g1_i1:18-830(+)